MGEEVTSFLQGNVEFWHWWVLAVLLMLLEVLAPGTFFLWLGLAAGVVGLLLVLLPNLGWQFQVLIFAVLSIAAVFAGRAWLKRHPIKTEDTGLNRRGDALIGQVYELAEPIHTGRGAVRVADTVWRAEGPDLPKGSRVRVIAVQGTTLKVEAA
ncbi:NfeD family protein [Hypericibacter sp.]|uniref:NfeD family protein n=1 Tax=Hypericibacter sp. TaxID=2705401 RepID=UPI003D6D3989